MKFLERTHLVNAVREENNTLSQDSASASLMPILPTRHALTHEARALDAVYRAIHILETSCRQLTVDVWRNNDLLASEQAPRWIARPSMNLTSFGAFTAETVSSLAQRGNAYWLITRSTSYDITSVDVLNPQRVGVTLDNAGIKRIYTLDGKHIRANRLMHLRLTHTPGEALGLSPLQACARTIAGALETAEYAANWTSTAGAPAGILTTDQVLSREQAQEYKAQANQQLQYKNGVSVLGQGLTYHRLLLTPAELQFLDAKRTSVTEIARMFGIPAKMLLAAVDGGSDTYSNAETENRQFVRQTLMAYIAEIEDALSALLPRGQQARYNLDGLLRADTKTRYETHAIGLAAGFLTTDEVRAIEGLQPISEKEDTR